MRSTVVVAAHNEGNLLLGTIRSVFESAGDLEFELLIADDQSTDGSVETVLAAFPEVKVVRSEARAGASGCKAMGADHATGDVLIFLDGHTKPEPGSLEALVKRVEETGGNDVITPCVPSLDTETWTNDESQAGHGYAINLGKLSCWWIPLTKMREVKVGEDSLYESPGLIGCAMAINRELYHRLQGFDPDMQTWGVEDIDLGLKCWLMGSRILHDPKISVGHRFRTTFTNFDVPMEHLLANQIRMARKNFTEEVWQVWLRTAQRRYPGQFKKYPEGLWMRAWSIYQEREASAEQERSYLMANRVHDELWYAEHFATGWPRLNMPLDANDVEPYSIAAFDEFEGDLRASPSKQPPYPKSLQVMNCTAIPYGSQYDTCAAKFLHYGIKVAVTYKILDQYGDTYTKYCKPCETVTNNFINGIQLPDISLSAIGPTTYPGTSKYCDNGTFIDAPYGDCTNSNFTQTWTQTIIIVASGKNYPVRVNNVTVTGTLNHGTISNGSDIQASV